MTVAALLDAGADEDKLMKALESIRVDVDERNTPSKKLIESCGGVFSGSDRVGSGETLQNILHYVFDLSSQKRVN